MTGVIELADMRGAEETEQAQLIEQINSLGLPQPVTEDDIYIRSCRLAGDAVDAGSGRFRTEDMPRLLEMTNGAPLLIGHDKGAAPIGRFFGGDIVEQQGTTYIRPKLFWPRGVSDAEDMRENIDRGIWGEASLGFTFKSPTCSICGEDIRRCDHMPGKVYEGKECFFWYDNPLRVTEGSIVYRGAQPGTGFELAAALAAKAARIGGAGNEIESQDKTEERNVAITITTEQLQRLGAVLELKGAETTGEEIVVAATKQNEELADQIAAREDMSALATIGRTAIESLRKDVLALDLQLCALKNCEQSTALQSIVEKSDWDFLQALKEEKEAELDIKDLGFRCPECGAPITELRQTERTQVATDGDVNPAGGKSLEGFRV